MLTNLFPGPVQPQWQAQRPVFVLHLPAAWKSPVPHFRWPARLLFFLFFPTVNVSDHLKLIHSIVDPCFFHLGLSLLVSLLMQQPSNIRLKIKEFSFRVDPNVSSSELILEEPNLEFKNHAYVY